MTSTPFASRTLREPALERAAADFPKLASHPLGNVTAMRRPLEMTSTLPRPRSASAICLAYVGSAGASPG
jgi:hypothetical protein